MNINQKPKSMLLDTNLNLNKHILLFNNYINPVAPMSALSARLQTANTGRRDKITTDSILFSDA